MIIKSIARVIVIVFVVSLSSCNWVQKPMGVQDCIILPDSLPRMFGPKCLAESSLPESNSKMIVFLDSLGCSCRIAYLVDYNLFVDYSEFMGEDSFVPIVIVATRVDNREEIIQELGFSRFMGYLFVDSLNFFESNNASLVRKAGWSIYLTDSSGKMFSAENPLNDHQTWNRWRVQIESLNNH